MLICIVERVTLLSYYVMSPNGYFCDVFWLLKIGTGRSINKLYTWGKHVDGYWKVNIVATDDLVPFWDNAAAGTMLIDTNLVFIVGWVGLWGFLWWAPSAKRKDHHGVSSGWSSVWHCSNTGLSSSQCEQISIILGVWPFCLTPFIFRSITFWRAYG